MEHFPAMRTDADYWTVVGAASQAVGRWAPEARVEVNGSLARGELAPPFSDLDLVLVVPPGAGAAVRDDVPAIASAMGPLLTIFVDPFSSWGTFASVYAGPFKVDWSVVEATGGRETWRAAWRGNRPSPYDADEHVWDWIWWLWGKVHRGKGDLVARELPRLWQFLAWRGVVVEDLPTLLPDPSVDNLAQLVRASVSMLPGSERPVARAVREAILGES